MKKTYVKPYIAVETFQLNAAIAAACSSEGKYTLGFGMNSCTLEDDKGSTEFIGVGIFGLACAANDGHDVINIEGDGNDTLCYHGPHYNDKFMNS